MATITGTINDMTTSIGQDNPTRNSNQYKQMNDNSHGTMPNLMTKDVQNMLSDIPEKHEGKIACYLLGFNTDPTTNILYPSLLIFPQFRVSWKEKKLHQPHLQRMLKPS